MRTPIAYFTLVSLSVLPLPALIAQPAEAVATEEAAKPAEQAGAVPAGQQEEQGKDALPKHLRHLLNPTGAAPKGAEPATEGAQAQETEESALDLAFRFTSRIQGDQDRLSRYLQRLALLYADEGHWQRAVTIAESIPNYRKITGYAQIARKAWDAGDKDLARELQARTLKKQPDLREQQGLELNRERALTHIHFGELEEAMAIRNSWSNDNMYLHEINSAIDRIRTPQGAVPKNSADLLPRDFMVLAEQALQDGNKPLAVILLKQSALMADTFDEWTRIELFPGIARKFIEAGDNLEAERIAADFAKLSLQMDNKLEDKMPALAETVEIYSQLGQREAALKVLQHAETIVTKPAELWYGHSYGALGRAYYNLEKPEKAYELWAEGLKQVQDNVNPRTRAVVAVEIFLAMHEAGAEPRQSVKTVAEEIQQTL